MPASPQAGTPGPNSMATQPETVNGSKEGAVYAMVQQKNKGFLTVL